MDSFIFAQTQLAVTMPGSPVRYGVPNPSDPVLHDLVPLRYAGELVAVQLEVRRSEDGLWRGRLLFGGGEGRSATAEIFCAPTESELWEAVHSLREHHLRDLYRAVAAQ